MKECQMMTKKRNKELKPVYGAVCIDWEGRRIYTSFSTDPQELIDKAEGSYGIVEIEEAHAGKPPIWKREE